MKSFVYFFYGVLFFILSPNVFFRIPNRGNKYMVAGVHSIIFGIIFFFTEMLLFKNFHIFEGKTGKNTPPRVQPQLPPTAPAPNLPPTAPAPNLPPTAPESTELGGAGAVGGRLGAGVDGGRVGAGAPTYSRISYDLI
jgi:hypothetical protein